MLETLESCPFCNSENLELYLKAKDYTVSNEIFGISKCGSCGLMFTNPRPDKESIGKYYESDDYISHTNSQKGLFNGVYQYARQIAIKRKYSLIKKYSPADKEISLIDVGCGTGEFLSYCKRNGILCSGIEPSAKARELARANHDLDVFDNTDLALQPSEKYDALTMWHVLEHVHDLMPTIKNINRILKTGGCCFIAVPNPTSYDAKKYQEAWAALDVPRHLLHFAPGTLKELFKQSGFELLSTFPMKMDAYYVSLLSEKYRSSHKLSASVALKSLITGFMSNLKASKPEDYSSVIYAFRKPVI